MSTYKYADQLADMRWLMRRSEIVERDNHRCQHCDTKERSMQVHHIAYIDGLKAWEYPDRLLITLCHGCHEAEHARSDESANRIVHAMRLCGATNKSMDKLSLIMEELCRFNIMPKAALSEFEIALGETWGRQRK